MKALIFVFLAATMAQTAPDQWLTKTTLDLNGDGRKEAISLDIAKGQDGYATGDYTLHVDKLSMKGGFDEGVEGFQIVDVDPTDKYKEIAVQTFGPSDDYAIHLYWYDGKRINDMGLVEGSTRVPGNSTVLTGNWTGSWLKWDKYVLDKSSRKLKLVPQELYWVGIEGKVVKSFPIYRARTDATVVANLRPGSKIMILACAPLPTKQGDEGSAYNQEWYLIKSESNLVGWSRWGTIFPNVEGIPVAD